MWGPVYIERITLLSDSLIRTHTMYVYLVTLILLRLPTAHFSPVPSIVAADANSITDITRTRGTMGGKVHPFGPTITFLTAVCMVGGSVALANLKHGEVVRQWRSKHREWLFFC